MIELDRDSRYPKFVYRSLAGVGSLAISDPEAPSFFACDFLWPQPRKNTLWNDFPTKLNYQAEETGPFTLTKKAKCLPRPISHSFSSSKEKWREMIKVFKQTGIDKTVFARIATYTFDAPLDPFSVLSHLLSDHIDEKVFAFFPKPGICFLGASPETLYTREGPFLQTEALAGTRTLDKSDELLRSQKDIDEFLFVKDEIADRLKTISKPFIITNNFHIKRNRYLAHLHYPFSCHLKESISDQDITALLHPTPATAGFPSKDAINLIKKIEPFDRGWYASPLGLISKDKSDLCVALRSALVTGNKLHIFTGAGITKDSDPDAEWEELNAKMHTFGGFYEQHLKTTK